MNSTRLERIGDVASRAVSLQPADPTLRRGLHFGIALVIVLGIGLAALSTVDNIPDVEWHFRPLWLGIGTILLAAVLLCNAVTWHLILHALGPDLDRGRASAIWFASTLGRYVPTSVLVPVVRTAMAEREGVQKRICLASVAYEVSLSLTAALVVSAYFLIDLPELRGHWERFLVLAIPIGAVIALQPGIFHRLANYALRRLGREELPLSLPGRRVFLLVGVYCLVFLLAGLSVFALAQSIYPLDAVDIPHVVGSFALATSLGILAFVLPSGLVAREASLAIGLGAVMPGGTAVAVAVLVRLVQLALELVFALAALLAMRRLRARGA